VTDGPVTQRQPNPSMVCPFCHRDDMVAFVPAIVAAGTSRVSYGGSTTLGGRQGSDGGNLDLSGRSEMSGESQTALAAALAWPDEPVYTDTHWRTVAVSVAVALVGCAIAATGSWFGWVIVAGAMAAVVLAARHRRRVLAEAARVRANWRRSHELWEKLRYCARDGSIWVPGGHAWHVDDLTEYVFLYSGVTLGVAPNMESDA